MNFSLLLKVLPTGQNLLERLPTDLHNLKHLHLLVGLAKQELPGISCLLRSSPNLENLTLRMQEPEEVDWVGHTKLCNWFCDFIL